MIFKSQKSGHSSSILLSGIVFLLFIALIKVGNASDIAPSSTTASKQIIDKSCSICLENDEDEIQKNKIVTRCHHFFCLDCINIWLNQHSNCPKCRNSITNNFSEEFIICKRTTFPTLNKKDVLDDDYSTYDQDLLVSVLNLNRIKKNMNLERIEDQEIILKIINAFNLLNKFKILIEAYKQIDTDLISLLSDCGINLNYIDDEHGVIPLVYAIKCGRFDSAITLIKNGADINIVDTYGNTPLILAIDEYSLDIIKALLDKGADLNAKNTSGETPLVNAIKYSNADIILWLIENGAKINIDSTEKFDEAPLYHAISRNKLEIAKLLIEKGADITILQDGKFPHFFYIMSRNDATDIINLLAEIGADLNMKDAYGETLLSSAIRTDRFDIITFLIEKWVDLNNIDGKFPPFVSKMKATAGTLEIISLLEKLGANLNMKDEVGDTLLIAAIKLNLFDIFKILIEKRVDINAKNTSGETPLVYAIKYSSAEIISWLIENGAKINIDSTEKFDKAPLYHAIIRNKLELAKLLIERGADITILQDCKFPKFFNIMHETSDIINLINKFSEDIKNIDETRLFPANIQNQFEIIKSLIEMRIDLTLFQDSMLPTNMISAAGTLEIISLLEKLGANLNMKDEVGDTLLIAAIKQNRFDIIKILIEKRVDINSKNTSGETPLVNAIKYSSAEIILWLIDNGAKINIDSTEKFDEAPLYHAIISNKLEIAKLLIERGADITILQDGKFPQFCNVMQSNDASDIIDLLAEIGADLDMKDESGYTLLIQAISYKNFSVADFLIKKGVDLNLADNNGKSPLLVAIDSNQMDMVKLLVNNGANVNSADLSAENSLIRAANENGYLEIVKFLRENGAK